MERMLAPKNNPIMIRLLSQILSGVYANFSLLIAVGTVHRGNECKSIEILQAHCIIAHAVEWSEVNFFSCMKNQVFIVTGSLGKRNYYFPLFIYF